MKNYKNVFFNHSLSEYEKKYGKRKTLLKFSKEEINKYNKFAKVDDEHYLLKGRKWWYINNTYYEIPSVNINPTIAKASAAVVLLGGIASAIAIPLALNHDTKPVTPPIVETECVITFTSNDKQATLPEPIKVKSGTKLSVPTSINPGKQLQGWFVDGKKWDFDKDVVSKTMTLEAKWGVASLKATFLDANGFKFEEKTYPSDSLIDQPKTTPLKGNLAFTYWEKDESNKAWDFNNDKIGESNITLKPNYADADHSQTVKFVDPEDTSTSIEEHIDYVENKTDGTPTTQPENPEKDGYVFDGWYDDEQCSEGKEHDFTKNSKDNEVIYAKFNEAGVNFKIIGDHNIDYEKDGTVKFNVNKGSKKSTDLEWASENESVLVSKGEGNFEIKGTGSVIISATKTVTPKSSEEPIVVKESFDCEVASFSKLDKNQLKEHKAVKKSNDIEGELIIPSRYYVDDKITWITITTIPEQGLSGLEKVNKVEVPVPTKEIEKDALSGGTLKDKDSLDIKDKTNKIHTSEGDKDPEEDIADIVKALDEGEDVKTVPNEDGLLYEEINDGIKITGYKVYANRKSEYNYGDLYIPLTHTDTKTNVEYPVIGFYYDHAGSQKGAFEDIENINSVTLQNNNKIETIDYNAFKNCKLTAFNFAATVEIDETKKYDIGQNSFEGCTNLLNSISLPNYLVSIQKEAFKGTTFTTIDIPSNVEKLGTGLFTGNTNLTTVNFARNSLASQIPGQCFKGCSSLKQFTVPGAVEQIQNEAFTDTSLDTIIFEDENSTWKYRENDQSEEKTFKTNYNNDSKVLGEFFKNNQFFEHVDKIIEVPAPEPTPEPQPVERDIEGYFKFTAIKENKKVVAYEATAFSTNFGKTVLPTLTEVIIPSHIIRADEFGSLKTYPVTKIGADAFTNSGGKKGGDSITNLVIPNTVTEIGASAFFQMSSLHYLTIPSSVTKIGAKAFHQDPLLSVDFGELDSVWQYDKKGATLTMYGSTSTEVTDPKHENALKLGSNSGNNGYSNCELIKIR